MLSCKMVRIDRSKMLPEKSVIRSVSLLASAMVDIVSRSWSNPRMSTRQGSISGALKGMRCSGRGSSILGRLTDFADDVDRASRKLLGHVDVVRACCKEIVE